MCLESCWEIHIKFFEITYFNGVNVLQGVFIEPLLDTLWLMIQASYQLLICILYNYIYTVQPWDELSTFHGEVNVKRSHVVQDKDKHLCLLEQCLAGIFVFICFPLELHP